MRPIDAEKLKRKLIEGDGHDDDRFTEGYNFAINEIRGYIDDMPTIEAEPVDRWISVKDRLPDGDGNVYEGGLEESKYVLIYGCYEDDYGYGIGTYIRDHINCDAGWSGCLSGLYELDCCNVTHWQPLPEPPKGE